MTLKTTFIPGGNGQNASQIISGAATIRQIRGDGNFPVQAKVWVCDSASEPIATAAGGVSIGTGTVVSVPIDGDSFTLDFGAEGLPVTNGLWVFVTPDSTFTNTPTIAWRTLQLTYDQ